VEIMNTSDATHQISTDELEVPFADGNVSGAVRVGGTVRRAAGPWTPAVHALLRHLEAVGFNGAPRVVGDGLDERGREVLTFLPGETAPSWLGGFGSDETLAAVARLIRRYHDAVAGFVPPPDAAWRFSVGAPRAGEIVCHNDLGPWNVVFAGGEPVALIDWDFAAPAPRLWDLAYALWRWVPLYADEGFGPPEARARRLAVFLDAYGLANGERAGVLDAIERRQRVMYDSLETWAREGQPAFAAMWRDGHGDGMQDDLAYVRRHRGVLARGVESR